MTERKEWLDALRALAMLIVMIWHFSNNVEGQWVYSIITAPIMIPLFFAITGYVFNNCNGNSRLFYKKLFYHLIIPWILLAFIKGGFVAIIRHSMSYYTEYILNLFTGDNLWYFPCCIIAEILHFHILKIANGNVYKIVIISIAMVLAGLYISRFEMSHYLSFSTALICQFYLFLGYIARNCSIDILKWEDIKKLLPIAFLIYVGVSAINIIIPPNSPTKIAMDVHHDAYYAGVILVLLSVITGLFILFVSAPKIKHYPQLLNFIGRNTIVFYIFHYDTLMPLELLINKIGINILGGWLGVAITLIWSILICSIISMLLNKYFPYLVGKIRISQ